MKKLEDFIKQTQSQLFSELLKIYSGKAMYSKDNFILVKGVAPIMLVAHLDTVHKQPVKDICTSADGNILMSPQGIGGDDRCGVYALVQDYEQSAIKTYLYFSRATRRLADLELKLSLIVLISCQLNFLT